MVHPTPAAAAALSFPAGHAGLTLPGAFTAPFQVPEQTASSLPQIFTKKVSSHPALSWTTYLKLQLVFHPHSSSLFLLYFVISSSHSTIFLTCLYCLSSP